MVKVGLVTGSDTVKNSTFDMTLSGSVFTTVMEAVVALAISWLGTTAVTWVLLITLVPSGLRFHSTTAVDKNPLPLTVRVKPGPPGAAVIGTSGWSMNGTRFSCAVTAIWAVPLLLTLWRSQLPETGAMCSMNQKLRIRVVL